MASNRRLPPLALLLAVLVPVAAACSALGAPSANLEGRTFLSTRVEGRPLVPGTTIRLSFERDNVGISAGCNSMGGRYRLEGGRLTVSDIMTTDMACEPPLMEQERWLAELLGRGATITVSGDTVTLDGAGTRVTLVDRGVAEPDRPLEGTRWAVEGLIAGDAVSSVPAGVTASIRIAGGRAEVEAGCNQGGAEVAIEPAALTFGPLALTRMACDEARMSVERSVAEVLSGRVTWDVEAELLTLRSGDRGLLLRAEG